MEVRMEVRRYVLSLVLLAVLLWPTSVLPKPGTGSSAWSPSLTCQQQECSFSVPLADIAEQLAELNEVTGAVFDDACGRLVLIGRHDPSRPPLSLDDLVMAFRAIYNGEAPAVSIDPKPYNNSVMQVAYFGGIEETHFGWVLFESDRFLKVYGQGRDNVTGEEIASNVEGYRSELDFASCRQLSNAPVWHRLWFEPGISEGTKVRISTDRRAILFDGAHMIVKAEYIPDESSRVSPGSDPAAEQFVAHVSAHLAEFAAEQPVRNRQVLFAGAPAAQVSPRSAQPGHVPLAVEQVGAAEHALNHRRVAAERPVFADAVPLAREDDPAPVRVGLMAQNARAVVTGGRLHVAGRVMVHVH